MSIVQGMLMSVNFFLSLLRQWKTIHTSFKYFISMKTNTIGINGLDPNPNPNPYIYIDCLIGMHPPHL